MVTLRLTILQSMTNLYQSNADPAENAMNGRQTSGSVSSAASVNNAARFAAGKWNRKKKAEPRPSTEELQKLFVISGACTIIADADLCVLSISSGAGDLFDISQACTGAPLSCIGNLPDLDGLIQDARLVLGGQQAFIERKIGKVAGDVLHSRMLPYRGSGGEINGIMVAWVSIAPLLLSGISPPLVRNISLESQLLRAKEEERRRIAHILHDDLQQLLCSIRLKLSPQDSMQMPDVIVTLDQAINIARGLSRDLNPTMLKKQELTEMLKWLVDYMETQFGMSIDVTYPSDCRIECEQVRIFAYQAIRELLFNVVKHSGTRSAAVKLERLVNRLRIDVIDNGRGVDWDVLSTLLHKPESQGLSTIREKLVLHGGDMSVNSVKNQGTAVQILIPCQG